MAAPPYKLLVGDVPLLQQLRLPRDLTDTLRTERPHDSNHRTR